MTMTIRRRTGLALLAGGLTTATLTATLIRATASPAPPPGTAPSTSPKPLPADLLWMIGPADRRPGKRPLVTPQLRERGRALFQERCVLCHGERGDGRGPLADRLLIPPTNFTTGTYKLRSTPAGALPTDEDLFGTLTRGLHGTSMQPWRDLPASDRWALVAHLKSLSPRFDREPRGRPVLVPIAPRETGDLLDEGERIYVSLGCGRCHGESGKGTGTSSGAPRAPGTPRPEPRDFSRGRFLRGAEMEDIYVTLKVGIAGTPMYPYPALYDDELWALAAYVRSFVRERPLHELPPARR